MARAYQLRRPAGVTFVLILTWIVAFLSLVRGFLGLLGWETTLTTSELEGSEGALFGAVELGLGSPRRSSRSGWPAAAISPASWSRRSWCCGSSRRSGSR